jgi:UDP-3-O-[3-hydroxymyristoyl] glucosamine N-acyltransferase
VEVPIAQIAQILEAEIVGDETVTVKNISGINEAEPGDLTFIVDPKYVGYLPKTKASAVLIKADIKAESKIPQIRVPDPREAIMKLAQAFGPPPIEYEPGVHPTAIVADDAILGDAVSVRQYAVIEPGATIGNNTVIGAHCYIGHYSKVGNGCMLYPRVTLRERVTIGNRVIIHPGTVIGPDGFGYDQVDGKHVKIPQIGTVVIEDDVEIGANTCIDRARFDKTTIGKGTKIDNLVQVAHNCEVGENSILCGASGLSGSSKLGKNVILAGQAGVAGHVKIGDNIIIGAQAGVMNNLEKPGFYIGSPATPHIAYKKRECVTRKLPEIKKQIDALQKKLDELAGKSTT